jgi:hypothetical protein
MPTYAEAFDPDQALIFYELESLDDALASEAVACESDREDMGDAFDGYLAGQLKIVRDLYARGGVWGTAFSMRAPHGEFGTIALSQLTPISREQFERARECGWLERVSISGARPES